MISNEAELITGLRYVIVLAGPVCAGKTTLARSLAEQLGAPVLAARTVIMEQLGGDDRRGLQDAGRTLEQRTQGRWLAEAAIQLGAEQLIVDAARTPAQAQALLDVGGETVLIYLGASEEACRHRYAEREDPVDAGADFDQMLRGELPLQPELRALADLTIETDGLKIQQVTEAARRFLTG